jgi:hypothetical protein
MSQPRRKPAAMTVDAARAAVAVVERDLASAVEERNRVLLTDDDEAVAEVDARIAVLRQRQRTATDRATLVFAQSEQEAAARRAKEHAALIGRVEAKLADRSRSVAKLADLVAAADAALLEIFAANRAILAAWPWGNGDRGAVMLGDPAVLGALSNEIFRVAGRPASTGGMPSDGRGPGFPGGRPERLEWIAMPERSSRPLVEKFKEAATAAAQIMSGGRVADAVPVNGAAHHGMNGAAGRLDASPGVPGSNDVPVTPASGLVAGQINAPIPDSDEGRAVLRRLLQRQAELAEQDGEEAEEAYRAVGKQISQLNQGA